VFPHRSEIVCIYPSPLLDRDAMSVYGAGMARKTTGFKHSASAQFIPALTAFLRKNGKVRQVQ
jgi:hypothetical protein